MWYLKDTNICRVFCFEKCTYTHLYTPLVDEGGSKSNISYLFSWKLQIYG